MNVRGDFIISTQHKHNSSNMQEYVEKILRNRLNLIPDLILDIPWEKGQHKKTPPKSSLATAR